MLRVSGMFRWGLVGPGLHLTSRRQLAARQKVFSVALDATDVSYKKVLSTVLYLPGADVAFWAPPLDRGAVLRGPIRHSDGARRARACRALAVRARALLRARARKSGCLTRTLCAHFGFGHVCGHHFGRNPGKE